jgi:Mechanosensitive ion channel, conserved TM helix
LDTWIRQGSVWLLAFSPVRSVLESAVAFFPNLFFIAVIVTVSYYIIQLVQFFFTEVSKGSIILRGFYPDWAQPTYAIARFLIIASPHWSSSRICLVRIHPPSRACRSF